MLTTPEIDHKEAVAAIEWPQTHLNSATGALMAADIALRNTLHGLPGASPIRKDNRYRSELQAILRSIETANVALAKTRYQINRLDT